MRLIIAALHQLHIRIMQLQDKKIEVHVPRRHLWSLLKVWHSSIGIRSYSAGTVVHDKLYIHGGQQLLNGVLGDFYSLDLLPPADKSYDWTKISTKDGPGKRARHVCVAFGDYIYLHGGVSPNAQTLGSLFAYSVADGTWKDLTNKATPRLDSHCAVLVEGPEPRIYLLFGYDATTQEYSNAVLSCCLKTFEWRVELGNKEGRDFPCPRGGSSASWDGQRIWVFGGRNDSDRFNDLWAFNTAQKKWVQFSKPEDKGRPLTRNGHSIHCFKGKILLYAGIHDITRELDDLNCYQITEQRWRVVEAETSSLGQPGEGSPLYKGASSPARSTERSPTKRKRQAGYMGSLLEEPVQAGKMIDQQRRKKFLESKAELLSNFDIEPAQAQKLLAIEPISQAMKDSLDMIGGEQGRPREGSPGKSITVFGGQPKSPVRTVQLAKTVNSRFLQPLDKSYRAVEGKRPCARDGATVVRWQNSLVVFGGDRHQMSFEDLYTLNLQVLNL